MRIPPYYKRPGWQRFFAGIIIGMLIGWGFFVYHFGTIHDRLIIKLKTQEITIQNLNEDLEELRSTEKRLNEENQKKLTIQEIEVDFTNDKDLRLNELTIYELKSSVINELKGLKGKDIASVAETNDLMLKTIENKTFEIGETKYRLKREQVYLFTTLTLYLKIEIVTG
ncbi:sporulation membrane protein YtrI [Alkalihalobacterium bogoriense]|uniref:sporulation membrane protein YtrI n=1 Tax=Alkalihalobacterium bogoriense TaxID=246272 RepID=UPI00047AB147|nr:sporulation membrane protein YtrI [Alkalihalobacterium bogoriense]